MKKALKQIFGVGGNVEQQKQSHQESAVSGHNGSNSGSQTTAVQSSASLKPHSARGTKNNGDQKSAKSSAKSLSSSKASSSSAKSLNQPKQGAPSYQRPQSPVLRPDMADLPELGTFKDQIINSGAEDTENAFRKDQYKFVKSLGQGTYGSVKEAIHLATETHVAIKLIPKDKVRNREARLRNELQILMKARHLNLLALLDWGFGQSRVYIVTELASGGELFDVIIQRRQFYEYDAATITFAILDAIKCLHDHDIVHRDIKPENIFLRDPEHQDFESLVVGDFGISAILSDSKRFLQTVVGSPGYMAVEVLMERPYGKPADIWSIATITYILLCGQMPWRGNGSYSSELQAILNNPLDFKDGVWKRLAPEAQDFLMKCLTLDPDTRMTADEALNHPWIQQNAKQALSIPRELTGEEVDLLPEVMEGLNAERSNAQFVDVDNTLANGQQDVHRRQSQSSMATSGFGSSADTTPSNRSYENLHQLVI
ncbi:hypothetical protein MP228_011662 [Amoeboaphelidium protococcarum]|nr:hypothetical protein MP228_011662 [Amoeboaphelidium protococcarum]